MKNVTRFVILTYTRFAAVFSNSSRASWLNYHHVAAIVFQDVSESLFLLATTLCRNHGRSVL